MVLVCRKAPGASAFVREREMYGISLVGVYFYSFYDEEKSHMRSGKKFTLGFLPTLLAVVAMLVVACGGPGGPTKATAAPAGQQNYRIDEPVSDISTFDPALTPDPYSSQPITMA